jgi:N-hydroxyarylamine O-acetyltransferase
MSLDLQRYLERIGESGAGRADLSTLRRVVYRHALSIPFENLDPFRSVPVSLELADVQHKLVAGGRGGWCFEQNLLLGEALRAMGFSVHDLAARVLWGREATAHTPRTHRLLEVEVDGRRWLADVGFGGQTPTGVLDLDDRSPQPTPHEPFRLRDLDGDLLLEAQPTGADDGQPWRPLYRFDRTRQWPVDFEAANFQLAHDSRSPFTTGLAVARPMPDGRWSLRNRTLTWRGLDGREQQRVLVDGAELLHALGDIFGIQATGLAGLEQRFGRLES